MASTAKVTGNAAQRRARAAALREAEQQKQRQRRAIWISVTAVGAVVVLLLVLIVVRVSGGGKGGRSASTSGPAPASVTTALKSVPSATFDKVGIGGVATPPKTVNAPALTADGKPRVVYIGAEYCPFCAAERWGMAVALSRFGTFSNLRQARSAPAPEAYPNTATLSFHGATYRSDLLSFTGVETETNVRKGNGYEPLDTPAAADQALIAKYDAPPYVGANSAGAIPFVYIGGKYMISGASYDPKVLAGMTQEEIAAALADPTTSVAKSVIGTANAITATLCTLTGGKPGNVCDSSMIKGIQAQINAVR